VGIPTPAVPTIQRFKEIRALVTISRKFSAVQKSIIFLYPVCSHCFTTYLLTYFALRTLQHNGRPTDALRTIFQTTSVQKPTTNSSLRSPPTHLIIFNITFHHKVGLCSIHWDHMLTAYLFEFVQLLLVKTITLPESCIQTLVVK